MDDDGTNPRKKRVSELFWRMDSTSLARDGVFASPGHRGRISRTLTSTAETLIQADFLFAQYRSEGPTLSLVIPAGSAKPPAIIKLASTYLHFGGRRWWFTCPGCQRRARILYAENLPGPFRCRLCLSLAYDSQLLHAPARGLRTACQIRSRFGFSLSPSSPFPPPHLRPRGMHMETYWRLRDKEWKAARKHLAFVRAELERSDLAIKRRLKKSGLYDVLHPRSD